MAENNIPPEKRIFGDGYYLRPNFIQSYKCKNVLIKGVTFKNSPVITSYSIHYTKLYDCVAGYYEPEPDRVDGVQGGLFNTLAVGNSLVLDGVILSNVNGQQVRIGHNSVKVQVTNSIFANMGALTTSNLGAGKGIDLREAAIDTFIVENTTFVNYQDRAIRHYRFSSYNFV